MTKSLPFLFIKIGILKELQYRVNFIIQVLQSLISLFVGLFVLALVFDYTTTLNGWHRPELLAVLGIQTLILGVLNTLIQPNMLQMMTDVREGTLDFVLTKPADPQLLVSIREFRIWQLTDVISGTVVLFWAILELKSSLGFMESVIFIILLICGSLMIYSFWLILTTASFWIVRMDQLAELFQGIYQAGRWPVTIYPGWLRASLTYIVPIAFAVTIPAEAVTLRLTPDTMLLTLFLTVLFMLASRLLFKYGLRNYSSASS